MTALTDPDLATVAMINRAKQNGVSWSQIAATIGCANGKAAKAKAKRLARQANAALIRKNLTESEVSDD